VSLEIAKGDAIASLQRQYGERGAPAFALEQSILPVHSVQDGLAPYPTYRPWQYQTDVGAVAAQFSYMTIECPATLQGDQRTVIEEIWTFGNGPDHRVVWDVRQIPFNNVKSNLPDMGFGEYPQFNPIIADATSFTSNYFVPVQKDTSQSATDYIIAGRDLPIVQSAWTRIPCYIILRAGQAWVCRPVPVNTQLTLFVRGRHYA